MTSFMNDTLPDKQQLLIRIVPRSLAQLLSIGQFEDRSVQQFWEDFPNDQNRNLVFLEFYFLQCFILEVGMKQ